MLYRTDYCTVTDELLQAPLLKDINVTVETQENVTAFNKQLMLMLGKDRLSESSYLVTA